MESEYKFLSLLRSQGQTYPIIRGPQLNDGVSYHPAEVLESIGPILTIRDSLFNVHQHTTTNVLLKNDNYSLSS